MGTAPLMILLGFGLVAASNAQVKWCVTKGPEMTKCNDMKNKFTANNLSPGINCVEVMHESQCLRKIQAGEADIKSVGDRGIYTGGNFSDLKPVISETRQDTNGSFFYKAVIVLKKTNNNINSITDVKGKRSCHTGVMRTVGWVVPVGILFAHGGMANVDCENNVKNVGNHFSQSCCPGAYDSYNNPDGNNPSKVCQACNNTQCPFRGEKYSSYNGAFRGVVDGVCDIAFVKHSTVPVDAKKESNKWTYNKADYQLLCPDGTRVSVDQWNSCSWATRPHNALVVRNGYNAGPVRSMLLSALPLFGPGGSKTNDFQLFSSSKYGGKNLMFSDSSTSFVPANSNDYKQYLGDGFINSYAKFRPDSCQKDFRWCTLSEAETRKCQEMRMAMGGGRITQDMTCVQGSNIDDCFSKIQNNQADLINVDGGHMYTGGRYYGMRPIAAELYDSTDTGDATYFGVAVIRANTNINLNQMRGKKTCHTGYGRTVGWNVPVGYFASRGDIKLNQASCNAGQAAANFFGAMCTPGAREGENAKRNPQKLCSLCPNNCQNKDIYGGYNGAIRCLKEKNADVAFVKHTTIDDVLNGNNPWAAGWRKSDFMLACKDGTMKSVDQWRDCHLAKVPSHGVVTSTKRNNDYIRHYQIALGRAESRYKNDSNTFFAMFASERNESNLLFKDSTQALKMITDPNYEKFLGQEYLQVVQALDTRRCTASTASAVQTSFLTAVLCFLLYLAH